jgi:hypothetical protein
MTYRRGAPLPKLAPRTRFDRLMVAAIGGRLLRIRGWRYRRAYGIVHDPERWARRISK